MRLWFSKGLFHIFYLVIFFVLPLAFPPCIGQEEETRTQQAFAALMAISSIVVIVESRSSLELRYLKNLLEDETVSSRENELRSFSLGIVLGETKIFLGVESYASQIFLLATLHMTRYQMIFNFHVIQISQFKSIMYKYYVDALQRNYDPENPRSWKTICPSCNVSRNVSVCLRCCY